MASDLPRVRLGLGPESARIMLVGECYGENEDKTGEPFVGESGKELNRILQEAGIMRSECYVTNVVNARPPNNDLSEWVPEKEKDVTLAHVKVKDKWALPIVKAGYESLRKEIDLIKPRVIIALGNFALWALTGAEGIGKWRSSLLTLDGAKDGIRVVPTYHPAAILRMWAWRADVVHDIARARRELERYTPAPDWKFRVRPQLPEVLHTLEYLLYRLEHDQEPLWLEVDLETRAGHIACCGLGWSKTEAISIPFMCVEIPTGYWTQEEEVVIVMKVQEILLHPRVRIRWQNGLYDAQYIYRHWLILPKNGQDTMLSQHVLFAGREKSLAYQGSMYADYYVYWKDDGKTWDKNVSEDQLWGYNCKDDVYTREAGEATLALIDRYGLQEAHAFQQEMFAPVLQAMNRGVRINLRARQNMALSLENEIAEREDYFKRVLGHTLNPSSSPQMQKLFYDDFGMPVIRKRGMRGIPGRPTLDDKALEALRLREPLLRPLIKSIQEWRSLRVFLNTFVLARLDFDNRMRCSYNIAGTETFRLSSSQNAFGSGTNLQNIPKGGEDDDSELELPNIRGLFIPDQGFTFFDTDLSKADLRIVVWEADEREMKAMLAEGRDPYVETAREFYRDPTISKTRADGSEHPKYRIFKSFSHGSHYLGTPKGLAERLGLTVHEAERTQRWYFGKYPAIPRWQEAFKEEIRRTRMVKNKWGYRRVYFDRIDDSVFREAIAWLPQSTVALLINKVWMRIYKEAPEIQVLLQVHDSLAGQFPTYMKEPCLRRLKELSNIVIPYDDPLTIPIGIKHSEKSWGDCE